MATKKHPAHHAPVEHRSHHAAKVEDPAVAPEPDQDEPVVEAAPEPAVVEAPVIDGPVSEALPDVVELPESVADVQLEPAQADPEAPAVVEVEPPAPREKTLADYFGCACGTARNLSMEAGVYRCHGCGTTHHAQTLEGRKVASK